MLSFVVKLQMHTVLAPDFPVPVWNQRGACPPSPKSPYSISLSEDAA